MTNTDQRPEGSENGVPVAERVYAPASERVPVEPVPGHREVVGHTDTHTPERQSAGETSQGPTLTSVTRPGTASTVASPSPDPYASSLTNPAYTPYNDAAWNAESRSGGLPYRLGWVMLGIGGGVGGWLFLRWRRERNKPLNRFRRQAKQAAGELRQRVPSSPEEAVRPAAGLTTALLSIALILWQQGQSRSRHVDKVVDRQTKKASKRADKAVSRATQAASDADLQKRLSSLKKRWDPSRLELEKIQISRR